MKICDYTLQEIKFIISEANFTQAELDVFMSFTQGNTIEFTAEKCNMSISTVKRIKSRIWAKIERIKGI